MDLDKAARKTNPTVLFQTNDSLYKVKPDSLKDYQAFKKFAQRVGNIKIAGSIKDLVTALKLNNTQLDSLTIVYCARQGSPTTDDHALDQKALRLLSHESQH